jgi:hypothetical protein
LAEGKKMIYDEELGTIGDFKEQGEEDLELLDEIERKHKKSFKSLVNRKKLSDFELDEMLNCLGEA